jgi:hypothetical protein
MRKNLTTDDNVTGIAVGNAGLVLVNQYIPLLFERLGLIADHKFIDPKKQSNAVHYLQYVTTGASGTDDASISLNNTLCGLAVWQRPGEKIVISEAHKELIEGMIQAVIGYWPAIGHSSIAGFRGNWLIRNGLLMDGDDNCELTVEKKAYDLLINKSPFSFSAIKYPWMAKALHVSWPF